MAGPVGRRDLVFDQRIHRIRIRHPQQRLGQTHQRNALIRRQAVFAQEHFHHTRTRVFANGRHQLGRVGRNRRAVVLSQRGYIAQPRQYTVAVGIGHLINKRAQRGIEIAGHDILQSDALRYSKYEDRFHGIPAVDDHSEPKN